MKHLKPPKFAYCRELAKQFKHTGCMNYYFSSTLSLIYYSSVTKEELELLFYAFRSFSYPLEQVNGHSEYMV